MTYRHIVLFRVHDDATDAEVSEALEALRALGSVSGALTWHVAPSFDTRKGRVIVEDATFASVAEFEAFRALPEHQEVVARMAAMSDWWVGDYESSRSKSS